MNSYIMDATSKVLPAAISTEGKFSYFSTISSDGTKEDLPEIKPISSFIKEDSGITIDRENKLFIKNNMAILGAYDFSNQNDEEIAKFVSELQAQYLDYKLQLVTGEFPLSIRRGASYQDYDLKDCTNEEEVHMSTHLVCVSNYKDIVFENLKHSTLSLNDKLSILGYFGAGPEAYSYGRFDNSKFLTSEERSELYDYEEDVLYGGKEYCK